MFCPRDDPFTCLGTYVVKQNDMDGGSYDTTSEVTAVSPNGLSIGNTTDHSAELIGAAGISVGETRPVRVFTETETAAECGSCQRVFNFKVCMCNIWSPSLMRGTFLIRSRVHMPSGL